MFDNRAYTEITKAELAQTQRALNKLEQAYSNNRMTKAMYLSRRERLVKNLERVVSSNTPLFTNPEEFYARDELNLSPRPIGYQAALDAQQELDGPSRKVSESKIRQAALQNSLVEEADTASIMDALQANATPNNFQSALQAVNEMQTSKFLLGTKSPVTQQMLAGVWSDISNTPAVSNALANLREAVRVRVDATIAQGMPISAAENYILSNARNAGAVLTKEGYDRSRAADLVKSVINGEMSVIAAQNLVSADLREATNAVVSPEANFEVQPTVSPNAAKVNTDAMPIKELVEVREAAINTLADPLAFQEELDWAASFVEQANKTLNQRANQVNAVTGNSTFQVKVSTKPPSAQTKQGDGLPMMFEEAPIAKPPRPMTVIEQVQDIPTLNQSAVVQTDALPVMINQKLPEVVNTGPTLQELAKAERNLEAKIAAEEAARRAKEAELAKRQAEEAAKAEARELARKKQAEQAKKIAQQKKRALEAEAKRARNAEEKAKALAKAEQERKVAKAAAEAAAKAEAEARKAAELKRIANKKAADNAKKAREAEKLRLQKEKEAAKIAQNKRIAEEKRIKQEAAKAQALKIAQEKKIAQKQRIAEEKRLANLQAKRIAQEKRLANLAAKKAENEKRKAIQALRQAEKAAKPVLIQKPAVSKPSPPIKAKPVPVKAKPVPVNEPVKFAVSTIKPPVKQLPINEPVKFAVSTIKPPVKPGPTKARQEKPPIFKESKPPQKVVTKQTIVQKPVNRRTPAEKVANALARLPSQNEVNRFRNSRKPSVANPPVKFAVSTIKPPVKKATKEQLRIKKEVEAFKAGKGKRPILGGITSRSSTSTTTSHPEGHHDPRALSREEGGLGASTSTTTSSRTSGAYRFEDPRLMHRWG